MLPRSRRLSRAGFEQIAGFRRSTSRHFAMSFAEQAAIPGVGVVVSKKVAKHSVDRHLLKRQIREIVRPWITESRAFVLFARTGASTLTFSELEAELTALLHQSFPSGSM
jgi:ribonuclease P protein component